MKIKFKCYAVKHEWKRNGAPANSPFATLAQAREYAERITRANGEAKAHATIEREVWIAGNIFPVYTPIVTYLKGQSC